MYIVHNIIMKILYLIISVIIILLIPIKVQVVRKDNKNDLNLYFVKVFNLKLDLDRLIKKVLRTNKNSSLDSVINNIEFIKRHNHFIKELITFINIKKITIIYTTNTLITSFLSWNSIYILRNYLITNVLNVENEYYNVDIKNTNNVSFELIFYMRPIYIIIAYVISIKKYFKKRGIKNVRTSD